MDRMAEFVDDKRAQSADRQRHPLARGVELLTLMVDDGAESYGVRDLGNRLGVSASTVHRLLSELEKLGMVGRTETGTYCLGPEFLRLAWTTALRFPTADLAKDVLEELTGQTNESSFFATYSEQRRQMMFSLAVESSHPLRYVVPLHVWLPLHAGASGLAILAFLPENIQREILGGPLEAITDRTLVDSDRLRARLERIRSEGYAFTHGERIAGAVAVAAPVIGASGAVVGDVGVTIPESRFNVASVSQLIGSVKQAARILSRRIDQQGE